MRSHLMECSINSKPSFDEDDIKDDYEHRLHIVDQDLNNMRSVLNEEIRQRLHLITDVGSLRKHNQVTDDWQEDITQMFDKLNIKVTEETVNHIRDFEMCQNNIRYCYDLNKTLRSEFEQNKDDITKQLGEVSFNIDQTVCNISENLVKLQDNLNAIDSAIVNKFETLAEAINMIERKIATRTVDNPEFLLKLGTLDYEAKSIKGFVSEMEEKCIRMDKTIFQVTKEIQNIHSHYKYYQRMASIVNNDGKYSLLSTIFLL